MADRWEDPVHTTSFGLQLVEPHTLRENRGSFIGLGIALLVLGALAILMPVIASLVTAVAVGAVLVASGIFQGLHAIQHRRWANSGWSLASALLQIAAGVLIVAFPLTGTVTLTLILAAFFFAEGFLKIVRALQHREMPAWGWLLFDGLLALALGVLIWWRWPSTAAWAIGLLVGVNLLVSGTSMLLIGTSARQRPVASM